MFQSGRSAEQVFDELKKQKAWDVIQKCFLKYKKLWNGPNTEIYIFPINVSNRAFLRSVNGRSGITFPNRMFLFLSPESDEGLWESLFVHEYHHAARMKTLTKKSEDFTLLDSLVFEGLAEQSVLKYCGERYLANWIKKYDEKQLKHYWKRFYEKNLHTNRKERIHDDLLFGKRGIPALMGYSIGYELVKGYKEKNTLSIKDTFQMPSEEMLNNNGFID